MVIFLDRKKTIETCTSERCDNCKVRENIHCHFTLKDLIHFYLIASPSFLIGCAGIYQIDLWWIVPWVIIILAYFCFIEIRVMCSHCPHYAEEGGTLKCWANYGALKIWQYRPGQMTFWEKVIFFAGLGLVWGYPLFFLVSGFQLFFLIVYLITVAGFFMTLKIFLCSQCMNFACPLNSVREEVRRDFFECNPEVAKAWDIEP